nr:uncharacterized protein LOC109157012 [Ipomoea trifida]
MKDSRRIMELAKQCSEVPWNLSESAVLDPEQSAPPTQTLAEPRTKLCYLASYGYYELATHCYYSLCGKEDKVLLPFSSLIYGILCKQGFRKHPQEEELSPTSTYSIDRRLFFKSHLDDCSTFKSAGVPEGESFSSTRSRVSVDFAAVSARVLTIQSILKSLKSTVVQMEKVLLEDKKLLQSFETDDEDLDSAPAR